MEKNVENSRNRIKQNDEENDKKNSIFSNKKLVQFNSVLSNKSNAFLLVNSIVSIVLFILVCFNLMEINKIKNEIHLLKLNNSKVIKIFNKLSDEIDDIDLSSSNEYFKVF
jgi:hypothetical protein